MMFLYQSLSGQNQIVPRIWQFGIKCGIDFRENTPRIIENSVSNNYEGVVTITDKDGNILVFSGASTIYNRDLVPMKNGDNLIGNTGSAAQSPILIQHPTIDNLVYIFYVGDHVANLGKFHYSIIDLCGDNGKGEVLPDKKNIPIPGRFCERLTFAYNFTENYFWILIGNKDVHRISAYKLDENGLNMNPINSEMNDFSEPSVIGTINLSNDNKKLAYACCLSGGYRGVKLANFDINTGRVTNVKSIFNEEIYDACFSSNSNYLYFTDVFANCNLYKYDLASGDFKILDSKSGNYQIGSIETGPDGNIYVSNPGQNAVGVIFDSDKLNETYVSNYLSYGSNCEITLGLQSTNYFRGVNMNTDTTQVNTLGADSLICIFENFVLDSKIGEVVWSDGSQSNAILINAPGTYYFYKKICNQILTDTIKIFNKISDVEYSTKIVQGCDSLNIKSLHLNRNTLWSNGFVGDSILVVNSGVYFASTIIDCIQNLDTFYVNIGKKPVYLPAISYICDPKLATYLITNIDVLWQNGTLSDSLLISEPGSYNYTLKNECGNFDSVTEVIDESNVVFPNIFSPNRDGKNDFFPGDSFQDKIYSLDIYDRWGNLVYVGSAQWDGSYLDGNVNEGVYTFVFRSPTCNLVESHNITIVK